MTGFWFAPMRRFGREKRRDPGITLQSSRITFLVRSNRNEPDFLDYFLSVFSQVDGYELAEGASQLRVLVGVHEQRAGDGVFAGLHGFGGGVDAVDLERLDGFVDKAEAGVADGGRGALHTLADRTVGSDIFAVFVDLLLVHDELREGFVGSAVGIARDSHDGLVGAADFIPVLDFAEVDLSNLLDG